MYRPEQSVWMNPNIEYLFDTEIIEYDMTDAGFSLIKQYQLLPRSKILELEQLDKGFPRHKAIGILQRDHKDFSKALMGKFTELRKIFLNMNELNDDHILEVRKDAIFTIGTCDQLRFDQIRFVPKNQYSSYIRFRENHNIELFYNPKGGIEVKGIGEVGVNKHRLYWIDTLNHWIPMIENKDSRIKRKIIRFIHQYKAEELDEEYYLEFNNKSREYQALYNFQHLIVPITQIVSKEVP